MSLYERGVEDRSPLKWEFQEKIDLFHEWYWKTIKKPFISWWVATGLISVCCLLSWLRDQAIVDDVLHNGRHGFMLFAIMILLVVVPFLVCPCLSYVIVNKSYRSRLESDLKKRFGDDEVAQEILKQILHSLPI